MNTYKLDDLTLQKLRQKRIILTASSGRCGTQTLAKLLNIYEDVNAVHEPSPPIDNVWWKLRKKPELAYKFLVNSKLPAILKYRQQTYVETSHQLCKGFFEPLHALGIDFDLIILSRNLHDVALSMYWLNDIPTRSKTGRRWYPAPDDPDTMLSLPKKVYKTLTDYQLCCWYCLEMEARKEHYYRMWTDSGRLVVKVTLDEITRKSTFEQFLSRLKLAPFSKQQWFQYKCVIPYKLNNKNHRKHFLAVKGIVQSPEGNLDEQEKQVFDILRGNTNV